MKIVQKVLGKKAKNEESRWSDDDAKKTEEKNEDKCNR